MAVRMMCCDLNGVLVRIAASAAEACARAGVSREMVPDCTTLWDVNHPLMHLHDGGEISCDAFCQRAAEMYPRLDAPSVRRVLDGWLIGTYEGVAELLRRAKGAGLATACLSNNNTVHWATIWSSRTFEALWGIEHRFGSHEIGHLKPAPAAFEHVMAATGYRADEILYFDDAPGNVTVARALGMQAHRVRPGDEPVPQMMAVLEGVVKAEAASDAAT